MPDIDIKITDNSQAVRQELNEAVERAMTRIGLQTENYTKKLGVYYFELISLHSNNAALVGTGAAKFISYYKQAQ